MTPFNIGQRIELHDFTEAEAHVLVHGLGENEQGSALLNRILYWTGGHPYLTQRLCQAVSESTSQSASHNPGSVDRLCEELFFARRAREQDDNLLFVRERMLRSEVELAGLLQLFARVHRGKRVEDDETNPFVTILKLSGITCIEDARLRVRNRIYERVFDQAWIVTNTPDAEVRRQRAAYRKGLLRAAVIAAVIVAVMASLAFVAVRERNLARAAEETNRQQLYAAQMTLAAQSWEDAGVSHMLDLLNGHLPKPGQEDLRGFEWYHLWGLGHGDLRSFQHGDHAVPVKFFPDNRRLVTGGSDHLVRIWDIVTGEQLMALSGHSDMIWSVAVSPDGHTLASTSADKTAKIWSADTGQEIATLRGHTDDMGQVGFAPDGKKMATASSDRTVKVWDVATWREIATFQHSSDNPTFAFSPDGRSIATACLDGVARLWDAATGEEIRTFTGGIGGPFFTLAFSPDGTTLVTGGGNSFAEFWDVATGKPIVASGSAANQKLPAKVIRLTNAIMSLSFSPSGGTLALASYDRTVKLFTPDTLQLLNTFKGHDLSADSVTFSPNGKLLATGGRDGVVKLWDVDFAQEPELPGRRLGMVFSMAFSPDGCCLATTGLNQQIPKLWDVKTQQELKSFIGHAGGTLAVAFSPNGQVLATGGRDKTAKLWDVATGREILTFKGHTEEVQSVSFSPNGSYLATGSWDKTARLWDVATGEELSTFIIPSSGLTDLSLSVMFSPDGRLLATGSDDSNVRLWNISTRREMMTLSQPKAVSAICFSPDGKTLAAGLSDGKVRIWDLTRGTEVSTLKGHISHISSLVFFPDGKRLVSGGGGDNTVKIWNVVTGQELVSFKHRNQLAGVAVSPDGRIVASGSDNVRLRFAADPTTSAENKSKRLHSLVSDNR
jgi:WD40 repeat protein